MMFPKNKKRKHENLPALKKRLDGWFSKYVRLRDADGNGMCQCITCGRLRHWKEMDAGHFQNRDKLGTRYNPKNVNAQCKYCNKYRSGEQHAHGKAVDRRYGCGTAEMLTALASQRCKLDRGWYLVHIEEYKAKVRALRKKKGLA